VVLPILKRRLGLDEVERVVILEPEGGRMFCMAPVGIDEGWTKEQKMDLVRKSMPLLRALGLGNRVAIMSGGREDDLGRNDSVDRTIIDAREIVPALIDEGYDAYDAEILLEDIVKEADLVIAPDGISGNIIFRALHFIGGAKALGAPVINTDKIFVDTSRAKTDYVDCIALAMKLTEKII
jgi:predicted methyltransferase MtxX (methanogen marker protein 4)